ncbi:hypothetical protein ABW05_24565 [Mycolicibacterium senegalense]|uniref:Uncharacterized protein n=1 Tax=Mycolicibacterium senegalense TaxID=1796 RepID=A0ABR5G1U8_9MYCO|nr:hypothetical protein AA982_22970 [Mycolicibacterium senegalense]KLO54098.1 hypothetical protein ABW05_24140 [Mycolicibacterium senegalense]KLO54163.1 hypothetical protein ABW05_24565 [Mycolicibacterium senegalense]
MINLRDLFYDLRHPVRAVVREAKLRDREYRRVVRFTAIGWPNTTAKMLREAANILETGPNPHTEVARWLRSVADHGNGYLKPSAYTLRDLEQLRTVLFEPGRPGLGQPRL